LALVTFLFEDEVDTEVLVGSGFEFNRGRPAGSKAMKNP
jgi:hypothetical protein